MAHHKSIPEVRRLSYLFMIQGGTGMLAVTAFQTGIFMASADWLFTVLDLMGTFVFGISGAVAGIRRRADLFGVMVLSFVAACFGGMVRDVLIGQIPPVALHSGAYLGVALMAGLITFYAFPLINRLSQPVLIFDAIGLSFFAVVGAQKALTFNIQPVWAIVLGMMTAVGGGIARDVMLAKVPLVLRAEIYAVAALLGATIMVVGVSLGFSASLSMLLGASSCMLLRCLSMFYGWQLPLPQYVERSMDEDENGKGGPDQPPSQ